jgi:riboflavin kinase/FMN adenylyltransferase
MNVVGYCGVYDSMFLMKRTGEVIHGAGRGKGLGFPTLNLRVPSLELPYGVYVARVLLEQKKYSAVMNWGGRPTFNEEEPLLEVHLLEAAGDFYGKTVELEIGPMLRPVIRFSSSEELVAQIQKDIAEAQAILKKGTF